MQFQLYFLLNETSMQTSIQHLQTSMQYLQTPMQSLDATLANLNAIPQCRPSMQYFTALSSLLLSFQPPPRLPLLHFALPIYISTEFHSQAWIMCFRLFTMHPKEFTLQHLTAMRFNHCNGTGSQMLCVEEALRKQSRLWDQGKNLFSPFAEVTVCVSFLENGVAGFYLVGSSRSGFSAGS